MKPQRLSRLLLQWVHVLPINKQEVLLIQRSTIMLLSATIWETSIFWIMTTCPKDTQPCTSQENGVKLWHTHQMKNTWLQALTTTRSMSTRFPIKVNTLFTGLSHLCILQPLLEWIGVEIRDISELLIKPTVKYSMILELANRSPMEQQP